MTNETKTINSYDSRIDSRDVIARMQYLLDLRNAAIQAAQAARKALADARQDKRLPDALQDALDDLWTPEDGSDVEYGLVDGWQEDEHDELQALQSLADEGESLPDWEDGACLINEATFEDYARELAEDIGTTSRHLPWPQNHIDWDTAADALKQDYTKIDWQGSTFYASS